MRNNADKQTDPRLSKTTIRRLSAEDIATVQGQAEPICTTGTVNNCFDEGQYSSTNSYC